MKVTEKQLIDSLKQLKEIKPRKEWALLLKSQILAERQAAVAEIKIAEQPEKSIGILDIFSSLFFQRKLAYSFVAALLLIIGIFGLIRYTMPGDLLFPAKKMAEQSQAALTGQTPVKRDVAALSTRVNELAKVAKEGKTSNIPSAISEVTEVAKDLKDNPTQDSQTIKDIANSLKTLADVPGADLTTNSDVQDLYQAVVQNQIADLQKTTLTDNQKNILSKAEDLYRQGKYADALEEIYNINQQVKN